MTTSFQTPNRSVLNGGNLLRNKWIDRFLRSRWFPGIVQWPTLMIFMLIMFELVLGPDSAHDNFGTAMTWVLWWPLIPIIFLFLGRFWCAICPFATINDLIQKFVGNNRPVPMFLKKYGIWIIDALFIFITWSDHVWGVVENPLGSGVLMLTLTTGVIASGSFFERRTFCRYVCFLGGLSGNYARTGMLSLRGTPAICATCTIAACYKGTEKAPGCPLFEFPKTMTSSANCVLCADCIKNCPNDSIQLTVRPPTKELWFIRKPKMEEAFLSAVIMGIVFVQNVTMLEVWSSMLKWLEQVTGTTSYAVTFSITFAISIIVPVALLSLASWIASKFNKATVVENFTRFGYAIIALDVAGHIAHNLFHLLAEGKSIFYTALGLFNMEVHGASPAILDMSTIQVLQFGLIALGFIGSLYAAYRISRSNHPNGKVWGTFVPFAALMIVLTIMNVILFTLPMAMRM
ncbi:MAG TPA: 4Fe-4S binding protein [Anaerolineales bacterium]|nr:4Fe-4S binding protein [Anaerolineales bacterium]